MLAHAKKIDSQRRIKLEADGVPEQTRAVVDASFEPWFDAVQTLISATEDQLTQGYTDAAYASSVEAEARANDLLHACAGAALRREVRSKALEAVFN